MMGTTSHFVRLLRKQAAGEEKRLIAACCGAGLFQGLTIFSVLSGLQQLADQGVEFATFALFLLSLGIFFYLFRYITQRAAQLALHGVMDWRMRLACKLRGVPLEYFEKIPHEKIQSNLINSQDMVVEASRMLMAAIANSVMMVVALGRMLTTSFVGGLLVITCMVLGLYTFLHIIRRISTLQVTAQDSEVSFSADLQDLQDGYQHLKGHLPKTSHLFTRWLMPGLQRATDLRDVIERQHALGISFFAVFNLLILGLVLFLLPRLFNIDSESVTTLLVLLMFCITPLMSLVSFVPMLGKIEMNLDALDAFENELDSKIEPCLKDSVANSWKDATLSVPRFESIAVENLSFSYCSDQGVPTFSIRVDAFRLDRSEIVFLCGGNGAGKTTFMRLLGGLYTAQSGTYTVNGRPLADIGLESLRNMFSLVPSDFHLFRHVLECPWPEDKVRRLLRFVQLDDKVSILPDGSFSTRDLSAGQKKRLALASALMEDREIYLFDEVAADFDPVFRTYFYRSILPELKKRGKTILAISHDDRYFDCADRVLSMQDGAFVTVTAPTPPAA